MPKCVCEGELKAERGAEREHQGVKRGLREAVDKEAIKWQADFPFILSQVVILQLRSMPGDK